MKQFTFEQKWTSFWDKYAENLILIKAHDHTASLETFPADYRRICQHLSLARTRCYSLFLCERLERLVFEGHNLLYEKQKKPWLKIASLLFIDFPIAVRRHNKALYIAISIFLLPAIMVGVICYFDSDFIYNIMPAYNVREMETMYSDGVKAFGKIRESDTDWMMFGYYIQNNISISFEVFAGGLLAGIGSLFYLFYNGLILGGVGGHLSQYGVADNFWSFVSGHGAFELTAIVIAGQAGLILAGALIKPGNASRKDKLVEKGHQAAIIISGTTIMLIIAAFLEAFWSSSTLIDHGVKYTVAAFFWTGIILFFIFSGRGFQPSGGLNSAQNNLLTETADED